ncbi:MAG: indolepyruvate oxidoreductase subunit beta [Caldimicrobium sp.]
MSREPINIIFVGTGGQGIVSASRILAWTAFKSGYEVKESEIHGMAQRGGTVYGFIRFGEKVFSPIIPNGKGDYMLALEELETLRYLHFLKKGALIILNRKQVIPASLEPSQYPQDIVEKIKNKGYRVVEVNATEVAKNLGSSKVENVFLLGILSLLLPFSEEIWKEVLREFLSEKMLEINLKAFEEGRRVGEALLQS